MSAALPSIGFETLRCWFDIAPDAMLATDQDGNILLANARAERMFGYATGALLRLPVEILVPTSLRHAHRGLRAGYLASPRMRPMGAGYELAGVRHDGQEFPVEIGLGPVDTEMGVVTIASLRDISATRRVRQGLERARRDASLIRIGRLALEATNYEVAIEQTPTLVAGALQVPTVIIFSTDWHRDALRVRASAGLSSEVASRLASTFAAARLIRTASTKRVPEAITMQQLHRGRYAALSAALATLGFHDCAIVPLFGRSEPLGGLVALATTPAWFNREKVHFLQSVANLLAAAVQRSLSEERQAHAQRLEAVGQLTGGIAHDFNNLLTVISGTLQLLESELADRPPVRNTIDGALRAVDRGSNLTRRLLGFARRQPLRPHRIAVRPLLEDLERLLDHTLGEAISLEVDCEADIADVYADPNELDTALINVAVNARDAMPHGGRLRIAAHAVTLPDENHTPELPPGRYVAFEVSDNGSGMSPDIQARAIEPFFTTKDADHGSGLGLSMVHGFVTQSGGTLTIDSRLGGGTRVALLLPAGDAAANNPVDSPPRPAARVRGHENILVVEDDADIRSLAARFLSAAGYRTIPVASAREAVGALLANAEVDLLFSDVVLGSGMDGTELAREARRIQPGIDVLLTSGYPDRAAVQRDERGAKVFELLYKPYRREELLRTVRQVLDREAGT